MIREDNLVLKKLKRRLTSIFNLAGSRAAYFSALVFFFGTALAAIEMAFAFTIQTIIKLLAPNPNIEIINFFGIHIPINLTTLLLSLLVFGVLRTFSYATIHYSAYFAKNLVYSRLRLLLFHDLLMKKESKSINLSQMNTFDQLTFLKASDYVNFCVQAFTYFVIAMGLLAALTYIAPRETLLGLAGLCIVGISVKFATQKLKNLGRERGKAFLRMSELMNRAYKNLFFIKAIRKGPEEYNRIIQTFSRDFLMGNLERGLTILSNYLPQFSGVILVTLVLIISQKYLNTPSSVVISFLYLFLRLTMTFATTTSFLSEIRTNQNHFDNAVDFFEKFSISERRQAMLPLNDVSPLRFGKTNNKVLSTTKNTTRTPIQPKKAPRVELVDVSFGFSENKILFQNVSLTINQGTQVGIAGQSGSGKSTFIGLILGLLKPTSGRVLIDGEDAHVFYEKNDLILGYVGYDSYLILGTLRQNICYCLETPESDENIIKMLHTVGLSQLFGKLPNGLDFIINESASSLSAGEKQRIALARALMTKPKILILDEASANLDEESEISITQTIAKLSPSPTIINVSHRRAMLQFADQIYVLSNQKLKQVAERNIGDKSKAS